MEFPRNTELLSIKFRGNLNSDILSLKAQRS